MQFYIWDPHIDELDEKSVSHASDDDEESDYSDGDKSDSDSAEDCVSESPESDSDQKTLESDSDSEAHPQAAAHSDPIAMSEDDSELQDGHYDEQDLLLLEQHELQEQIESSEGTTTPTYVTLSSSCS
jgi:hypothetical protein